MSVLYLFIFTLLSEFVKMNLAETKLCDPEICNMGGECKIINNVTTCHCIETFYKGDNCSEEVSLCSEQKPCKAGPCNEVLGGYSCECPYGYEGQKCDQVVKNYVKVHLLYNQVVYINEDYDYLLIVEDFGQEEILFEFNTTERPIDARLYAPKEGPKNFKYSKNLRALAKSYKVRGADTLPVNKGYYVHYRVAFNKIGHFSLMINVISLANKFRAFEFKYKILSVGRYNLCYPEIYFEFCQNPNTPYSIMMHNYNNIRPVIKKTCDNSSNFVYKWGVMNYFKTKALLEFKDQTGRQLTISPFALDFKDIDEKFRSIYTLNVELTEYMPDGKYAKAYGMCYVKTIWNPPVAVIIGGYFRQTFIRGRTTLDASQSLDIFARKFSKRLRYIWNCTSSVTNKYCKSNKQGPKYLISPNSLLLGNSYNFTVTIRDTKRAYLNHTTWQVITPVNETILDINIKCVRNCFKEQFNTHENFHVIGECLNCNNTTSLIIYSWIDKTNQKILGNNSRLILTSQDLTGRNVLELLIIIIVTDNSNRTGFCTKSFYKLKPPYGGKCLVSPTQGEEFYTIFNISCQDYHYDDENLIYYKFYDGAKLITKTPYNSVVTRLSETFDRFSAVRVEICSRDDFCSIIFRMNVSLGSHVKSTTFDEFLTFLNSNQTENINYYFNRGDADSGSILANVILKTIAKISNRNERRIIQKNIFDGISKVKVTSGDIFPTLSIFLAAINSMELNSYNLNDIEYFINKIAVTMTMLKNQSEQIDYLQYLNLIENNLNIIEKLFHKNNSLSFSPNIDNNNDDFEESYPDYGVLDYELIDLISNWNEITKNIEIILQNLGIIARNYFEPYEHGLQMKRNLLDFKYFVINNKMPDELILNSSLVKINIPSETYVEISQMLKDPNEIGIQILQMKELNPFWWYPEQVKIKSNIISLSLFSDKTTNINLNGLSLNDKYYDIYFNITEETNLIGSTISMPIDVVTNSLSGTNLTTGTNSTTSSSTTKNINKNGYLCLENTMVIYGCKIKKNAMFIFKFTKLDDDIRIIIKIGTKPIYPMLSKDSIFVSKSLTQPNFSIINNEYSDSIVYIAIASISSTSNNSRINFSFQTTSYSCVSWNFETSHWSTDYCIVAEDTSASIIHCKCNHMSQVGAKAFPLPNEIVLPRSIAHAASENSKFFIICTIILITFTILMIWAWKRDRIDYGEILISNYNPINRYEYVITVATGNYPFAGTTACVTIKLNGTERDSDTYKLYRHGYKGLFRRNTIISFTLYTAEELGRIRSITLSHDNTGRYPSWHCSMVRVKDVKQLKEYIFLVEKWLSYIYNDTTTITVHLATKKDLTNMKFLFTEYFTASLSQCILWRLIYNSHTKELVNRKEKVMIIFTGKVAVALTSAFFYGKSSLYTIEEEEDYFGKYIATARFIVITSISAIISMVVSFSLIAIFEQSRSHPFIEYKLVFAR